MSKATKRKHVTKEVLDEYVLPKENQQIVKIIASRGNNLHEAENPFGEKFLISMPTKFRKNVWIKRGDFVLTDPIEEGDKVKAEISHILYRDQIKYIKDEGHWPETFEEKTAVANNQMIPDDMLPPSDSEEEDEDRLTSVNPNRPPPRCDDSSEDESEEES